MIRSYKNFWGLNVDEAVVAGILRSVASKKAEVFMPLNAQMKGVDLVVADIKRKKLATVQVKGSRAYESTKSEAKKFGEGSGGWFYFPTRVIRRSVADYFVFLVYVLEQSVGAGRRDITPHTLTIATHELKQLVKKHKKPHGGRYSFYFRINPRKKVAIEWRDEKYVVSEYLDERGIGGLMRSLK